MSEMQIKTTEVGKAARMAGLKSLFEIGRSMAKAYNHDATKAEAGADMHCTILGTAWEDLTETQQSTWAVNVENVLFGLVQLHDQYAEWVEGGSIIPDEEPHDGGVPEDVLAEMLNKILDEARDEVD